MVKIPHETRICEVEQMPKFHPRITHLPANYCKPFLQKNIHKKGYPIPRIVPQILNRKNHVHWFLLVPLLKGEQKWKNLNGQTRGLGSSWIGRKPPIDIHTSPS